MSDAMFRRMQQTRIHNLEQELKKYEQVIEVQKREYFDLKKEYDDLQNELAKYRWISVDNELPEVNKEVLCRNEYDVMTLGHIDDDEDMWETDVEGFNVRYWMFLPFEDVQEGEIL